MRTLFDYIIGKKGEDTITGVLLYILIHKRGSDAYFILREFLGIEDDSFISDGQHPIQDGRLDIFIRSTRNRAYCVVIENKLDASFTINQSAAHQLERYSRFLVEERHEERKVLLILAPSRRRREIEAEIAELKQTKAISLEHETRLLHWEDLCMKLKQSRDETQLIGELTGYIHSRYLFDITMSNEDMNCLRNRYNGVALRKAFELLEKVRITLDGSNCPTALDFDKEDPSYGFYFNCDGTEYWLGLWFELWADTGLPLVLQKRIKTDEESGAFKIMFRSDGLRYPFLIHSIENFETPEAICREVHELIKPPVAP